MKEIEQAFEAIDTAYVNAASITDMFAGIGVDDMRMDVRKIKGEAGETELIKLVIPGKKGKSADITPISVISSNSIRLLTSLL